MDKPWAHMCFAHDDGSTPDNLNRHSQKQPSLVAYVAKLWPNGKSINVRFVKGESYQKDMIKAIGPEWSQYANLSFTFNDDQPAEILVDFDDTAGHWSQYGIDSLYAIKNGQRSMNIQFKDNSPAYIRMAMRHEFGHAIGMIHEHLSPYETIPWNKVQVYKDLEGPPNSWSKDVVDNNMFNVFPAAYVKATSFDKDSVMLYSYPSTWTTDGSSQPINYEISFRDKRYAMFLYPFTDIYSAGSYNTQETRPTVPTIATNHTELYLSKQLDSPTPLAIGINWLDMGKDANFRLRAYYTNPTTQSFTACIDAWADTALYAAGINYLEVQRFPGMRSGVFSTDEIRSWDNPQLLNSKRINFAEGPFGKPPKVISFINGFDLSNGANVRLRTYVTDIDASGFTIHVDSWSDSVLYTGVAGWIAYPADMPSVASGTLSSADVRDPGSPGNDAYGYTTWPTFNAVSRVWCGLNMIDMDHTRNLRWKYTLRSIQSGRMSWDLQSWDDTINYQTGMAWFAWQSGAY